MKTYRIKHTDLTVSRLSYGCAVLGGWTKGALDDETIRTAERLVHTACDQGVNLFDLADFYGFGAAERAFGEVLKRSPGLRDRIVLQSKCGQIMPGDPGPDDPYRVDLSREHILNSVDTSLERLCTDHLDILLLHTPDPLMDPAEVGQTLAELKASGKVRYFGVSNYSGAQIARIQAFIDERLVINQIQLGLGHAHPLTDGSEWTVEVGQKVADVMTGKDHFTNNYLAPAGPGTFDYCWLHDIQIQAWAPVRGDLIAPAASSASGQRAAGVVADMAAAKGVSPAAIVLAWLLRHPAGIVPVFGSMKPEHVVENCRADDVPLSRAEWYALLAAAARLSPAGA